MIFGLNGHGKTLPCRGRKPPHSGNREPQDINIAYFDDFSSRIQQETVILYAGRECHSAFGEETQGSVLKKCPVIDPEKVSGERS